MKTITYYPTMFHTNPFAHNWTDIYSHMENNAKDVLLQNQMVAEKGISEMILNVRSFAAIDEKGNEHLIKEFAKGNLVDLKGTHSGLFIKTNSAPKLKPGTYNTFRFYLRDTANTFVYKDRSEEVVAGLEYIDFDIDNGLKVDGKNKKPVIMRFDFEPYTFLSFFKPITDVFKRQKRSVGKLVSNLS
ncbi:hypothetical protein [Muriicola soli]|uniref:Uncharacterized protein n=1 Tax=Muriicola soli TaxID=2507538 RepID=A0A411E7N4_9FLAO|nr:hypothetical protein [Muriicola soli]QBA63658.1 hypothetical protein EQY75_03310 [Muriicola soli]